MYERYCTLRDNLKLKDSTIASSLNITPSTFSDWKKGKSQPNVDKLVKIARYLGTTVEYLVTGETSDIPSVVLSSDEEKLLEDYRALNRTGKEKAAEYISDLKDNDKYIKDIPSAGTHVG